ncbi:MAG TPA: hypothetical protein VEH04_09345 [Verrucomicrobiae bacterium]|nr:hypothetical protein [Verrucomicrobiae bacterium]
MKIRDVAVVVVFFIEEEDAMLSEPGIGVGVVDERPEFCAASKAVDAGAV